MKINNSNSNDKKKKKKDKSIIEGAVLAMIQAELNTLVKQSLDDIFGDYFKGLK